VFAAPVTGLGLAQDYLEDKTLHVQAGNQTVHRIELQNPDDEFVAVQVLLSGEYATFDGQKETQVTLRPKALRTYIPITIDVPENATPGEYNIKFSVMPVVAEEGMITMALRLSDSFILDVTQRPGFVQRATGAVVSSTKNIVTSTFAYVIVALAAVCIIILFIYKRSSALSHQVTRHQAALKIDAMSDEEFHSKKHTLPGDVHKTSGRDEAIQQLLRDE
jgi:hypothetical protein